MAKFILNNMVTVNGVGPYRIIDVVNLPIVNRDVYYVDTINRIYFEEELELADTKIEEKILAEIKKATSTPTELFQLIYSHSFQISFEQFCKVIFQLIQDEKIIFNQGKKLEEKPGPKFL